MTDKRHQNEISSNKSSSYNSVSTSFVLEKGIFSNIFEKDIKRVYIYKKSERLAKAIHLITPAFRNSPALRERLDRIAVGLIDAGTLPLATAKTELSRELLTLSSVLNIARSGGLLSEMNADLISKEAHLLLQEVALYEEPRMFMEDAPSLAELAKESVTRGSGTSRSIAPENPAPIYKGQHIGHEPVKDKHAKTSRREAILDILRAKGSLSIKDVSTHIRDVSEKTIQRELQTLIDEGVVNKNGERRWTVYSVA